MNNLVTTADIKPFIEEDIGTGDITAEIISEALEAEAEVIAREDMVLCGRAWFNAVFRFLDAGITVTWLVEEGQYIHKNTILCRVGIYSYKKEETSKSEKYAVYVLKHIQKARL